MQQPLVEMSGPVTRSRRVHGAAAEQIDLDHVQWNPTTRKARTRRQPIVLASHLLDRLFGGNAPQLEEREPFDVNAAIEANAPHLQRRPMGKVRCNTKHPWKGG